MIPPDTYALVLHYGWIVLVLLGLLLYKAVLRVVFGTVIVSKDQIGIVNKKWVLVGKHCTLPDGSIVALHGEAGLQADTLAPGIHFGLWAWQYAVSLAPFTRGESGDARSHHFHRTDSGCAGSLGANARACAAVSGERYRGAG